jgi:hypothetical protein
MSQHRSALVDMDASREDRLITLLGVAFMSWGSRERMTSIRSGGVYPHFGEEVVDADLKRTALISCRAEGPGVGPGGIDQHVDVSSAPSAMSGHHAKWQLGVHCPTLLSRARRAIFGDLALSCLLALVLHGDNR